jgi:hypothetical protein
MSVLAEIAQKLVDDGVGTLAATTVNGIFYSSKAILPHGDGPFLVLIETGGVGPGGFRGAGGRTQNQDSVSVQHPTVQVNAIGENEVATRALAKAAYDALDGHWNVTLSGTFYLSITARQEPTDTGLDDKGRIRITFNIDASKAPS